MIDRDPYGTGQHMNAVAAWFHATRPRRALLVLLMSLLCFGLFVALPDALR
jgi:hypothetical protein